MSSNNQGSGEIWKVCKEKAGVGASYLKNWSERAIGVQWSDVLSSARFCNKVKTSIVLLFFFALSLPLVTVDPQYQRSEQFVSHTNILEDNGLYMSGFETIAQNFNDQVNENEEKASISVYPGAIQFLLFVTAVLFALGAKRSVTRSTLGVAIALTILSAFNIITGFSFIEESGYNPVKNFRTDELSAFGFYSQAALFLACVVVAFFPPETNDSLWANFRKTDTA